MTINEYDVHHDGRWSRRVIHRSPGLDNNGEERFAINLCVFFTLRSFSQYLNEIFVEMPTMEVEFVTGVHATTPWRYYDVDGPPIVHGERLTLDLGGIPPTPL